jgi:CRP/FNR family nitrogen fixation transcriptional regulator
MLADSDPIVARESREFAFTVIAQLQTQLLVVGRTTAREKVGSFLFEMSHRLERDDRGRVVLPVSRYDIADYLAISAETVSRSISRLRGLGLINLAEPRHVRILNNSGLRNYEHPVHPRAST